MGRIPTDKHSILKQPKGVGAGWRKVLFKLPHQWTGPKGQRCRQPGPAGRDTHPNHEIRRPKGPTIHFDTRGFLGDQRPGSGTFVVVTQPGTARQRQGQVDIPSTTCRQHHRLFEQLAAPEACFTAEHGPCLAGLQVPPGPRSPCPRHPGSPSFPRTPAFPVP